MPRYAQYPHRGEYPEYGGGGEAWCSPSSVAMVRAAWGRAPGAAELAGIHAPNGDAQVPYTAIRAYDHAYRGTGNWAFSAAAAAGDGLEAYVDRFADLAEAERMLAAGIPLIGSVSFTREQLPEAGYATAGHLLVIRGVTEAGDVIVNDPAAASNEGVRRVYPRAAFEAAWRRGSGGVAYVVRPAAPGVSGRTGA
ncbi:C39 family peptidase [Agromyces archimandritae]|uniref:C39 family peptidase n=1 Tax=Agromyces archimandritae TaxID=2781962 RepID=A0A975IQ30_9MICO|nr:C39 family peptidase [Agromyces archimandritae]QTX05914.1 C39 family peptidase [Agromyces archimandritae]